MDWKTICFLGEKGGFVSILCALFQFYGGPFIQVSLTEAANNNT